MVENGAQEFHIDFYARFVKYNQRFSLAVQSPASHSSPIWQSGLLGRQDSVRPRKTGG